MISSKKLKKFKRNISSTEDSKIETFVCDFMGCGQHFGSDDKLIDHLKTHSKPEKRFKCEINCGFSTDQRCRFVEHMNSHNGIKPYECSSCGKTFTANRFLDNHIKQMHKLSDKLLICDFNECKKVFKTERSLKTHKKLFHIKGKPFVCDYPDCHYKTISESLLKFHKTGNHSTEPSFKCNFETCLKTFTTPYTLRAHIQTHISDDNQYKCPHEGCDKSFRYSQSLHRHKMSKHSGISYVCEWPECKFTTTLKVSLDTHSSRHTNALNLVCNWPHCDKQFKHQLYFNRHIAQHLKKAVSVDESNDGSDESGLETNEN